MITEKLLRFLKENWVSLLIVVGLPLAWFVLRSEGTALASVDAFERMVATGQPVVVDFFSNG